MKTKLLVLLLITLFISPMSEAMTTKKRKRIYYREVIRRGHVVTRIPIDYTIDVISDENSLQIIFLFPLQGTDITVTDKNGNVVAEENQTNLYEGKMLYVHSPQDYPYTVELTSSVVDITGEIVLEEEN